MKDENDSLLEYSTVIPEFCHLHTHCHENLKAHSFERQLLKE
jgi:hypothetical protein